MAGGSLIPGDEGVGARVGEVGERAREVSEPRVCTAFDINGRNRVDLAGDGELLKLC